MAIVCVARTSSAPRAGRARGRAAARRRGRCAAARVRGVVAEGCGERGAAARVRSVAVVCSEGMQRRVQRRGAAKGCGDNLLQLVVHQPQVVQRQRAALDAWHAEELGRQRQPQRDEARSGLGGGAARVPGDDRRRAPSRGGGRYHSGASRQSVASRSRISLKASACDACGGRLGAWGCSLRCVRWQAGCVGVQPVVHGVAASACWRIHVAWTT